MTIDGDHIDRAGLSGTAKVLLVFGIAFGVIVALCAGGGYLAYRAATSPATNDAAAIREITDEIATIAIPESLPPLNGKAADFPFGGSQARYHCENVGSLTLTESNEHVLSLHPQERQKLKDQAERLKPKAGEAFISDVEVLETTVHDQPATFTIGNGKDDLFWMVIGEFQGKSGPVLLEMNVEAPAFSKEQVLELLNSIR